MSLLSASSAASLLLLLLHCSLCLPADAKWSWYSGSKWPWHSVGKSTPRVLQGTGVPPPPAACACVPGPSTPLQTCDFWFQGSQSSVPTYSLLNAPTDQLLSTRLLAGRQGYPVTSANPAAGVVLCGGARPLPPASPGSPTLSHGQCDTGSAFYFGVLPQPSTAAGVALYHRTFAPHDGGLPWFRNKWVKVPIQSARIQINATSAVGINPGDNNAQFPESRRCVVFRTGPSPPDGRTCCPAAPAAAPALAPAPAPTGAAAPAPAAAPVPAATPTPAPNVVPAVGVPPAAGLPPAAPALPPA